MIDRPALAAFLRHRREALQPEDVGLPRGPRRRTGGLRREEVAESHRLLLRAGRARVTHQTSIAARSGSIPWDDIDGEREYDAVRAYSASKIAVGLFARELDARSRAGGWGISSNLSHPGVSPTNLLAAQPGMGRARVTPERRIIGALSRIGVTGTPQSAALPALRAATATDAAGDEFYGPKRVVAGPPTRVDLWEPLRSMDDARRVWEISEAQISVGARE